MQDYRRAAADYTKAIERNPNDADYYLKRGMCYQELGDSAKADADFDKVLELRAKK